MLRFLQTEYTDPRSEIIPRAPDIYGDLPTAQVTPASGDVTGFWASLFGGDWWLWLLGGIGGFIASFWSVYTFLAYLFSLILIVMYIYATIRYEYYTGLLAQETVDEEKKWNQLYGTGTQPSRLDDVMAHAASNNPNDWKLAIIEADIILDQTLKERGYIGDTLGERLRSITPSQLSSIDDAWQAHIVRNKIAHQGADFVLTKRIADQTLIQYQMVFAELGVT